MSKFIHFHVHTHYSILDGAAKIDKLLEQAKNLEMPALSITDHGNMFGVFEFYLKAKELGIKPIIGVETYIARNGTKNRVSKDDRSGYHLILLAKNKTGYKNLTYLVSRSNYDENFYYTPRMDKSWFKDYNEGLIALSACLGGEVAQKILYRSIDEAEKTILYYKEIFGDDYYLEVMNHGLEEQKIVNEVIFKLAKKHNIKVIPTNDVHFINKNDFDAHKLLIMINTGRDAIEDSLTYTGHEYLKSYEEMLSMFPNREDLLQNTLELCEKIENYDITSKPIMPIFPIPAEFKSDFEYLKHLAFEGLKKRYKVVTQELIDRLNFELSVIEKMGFEGYFLIVQDFIAQAKKMGVLVGPGRGSAAGSLIAYCIGITNIDPIKYKLLFERFLNPERISMPDIDIDFDDEGREKVLEYVVNKYGKDQVAQIITFGTLGAKLAIKDAARSIGVDHNIADNISKFIPSNYTIDMALNEINELKHLYETNQNREKEIIEKAKKIEGSIRQTSVHACGVIIGRENLSHIIPLARAKDIKMFVSQYEGLFVEKAGLLKMDFLGLKTLSIIRDTIEIIKENKNIEINIDEIPLDDEKTFELFQKGDTTGIFQFESAGMRKYLKELKPTNIEDLIAMNALYRPGPMQFIDVYIRRKHGLEKTEYPHPLLEPILKDTYGIMVYQEQIMEVARTLAGFTLGQADNLRRGMTKKMDAEMEKLKEAFIKGAKETNNIDEKLAEDIYQIMREFAKYGFNRSHSAAYSILAFQTAWLKTHYPVEFIAASLINAMKDNSKNDKIGLFINEIKNQNIEVLGPDINESNVKFNVVNNKIRFGLGAIKNVGELAAEAIVKERKKNGPYKNIFDFVKRVIPYNVNKRALEALAYAGAFDSFGIHRAQLLCGTKNNPPFIEQLLQHFTKAKQSILANQISLFDNGANEDNNIDIKIPDCEPFSMLEQLKYEKEYMGVYINKHPIEHYNFLLKHICNTNIKHLNENKHKLKGNDIVFAGLINEVNEKISKTNNKYAHVIIEDETGTITIPLYKDKYQELQSSLNKDNVVVILATILQKQNSNSPNDNDRYDIKINNILTIEQLAYKIKNANLYIPINFLFDDENYNELVMTIKEMQGNIPINFTIVTYDKYQQNKKISFQLINNNYKVSLECLQNISDMKDCKLEIKMNTI